MNTVQMTGLLQDNKEEYGLSQLIFINSGSNAYTKLRLDESLAITMSNNGGKSANLRALKLLLLPEVNFLGGDKKFAFQSADGKIYSDEESYKFYFPGSSSFIIGEITNPHKSGSKHCQVLMRSPSDKLAYQRWFIPASYDEIESIFFDVHSLENRKLGALTYIEEKAAATKFNEMDGQLIKKKKDLKKMLFSTYNPGQPDSFFSLFPMSEDPTDEHIDAFKALIHLAFNMKAGDGKSTALAVSTILSRIISDNSKFQVDLGKIPEEASELMIEKNRLDKMFNLLPLWSEAEGLWANAASLLRSSKSQYATLRHSLSAHKDEHLEIIDLANDKYNKCKQEHDVLEAEHGGLKKDIYKNSGIKASCVSNIDKLKKKLEAARLIRGSYGVENPPSDQEIADIIKNDDQNGIVHLEELIEALESRKNTVEKLETEIRNGKAISDQIATLNEQIKDSSKNIASGLSPIAASVMIMLMPDLENTIGVFNDTQKQTIEAFAKLFNADFNYQKISFLTYPLPSLGYKSYDIESLVIDWKKQLETEQTKLRNSSKNQLYLKKAIKEIDTGETTTLDQAMRSLEEARIELIVIESAATNELALKEQQVELKHAEETEEELAMKIEGVLKILNEAVISLDVANREQGAAHEIRKTLRNIEEPLDDQKLVLHRIFGEDPNSFSVTDEDTVISMGDLRSGLDILKEHAVTLADDGASLNRIIGKIDVAKVIDLTQILPEGLIAISIVQFGPVIDALGSEFGSLDNIQENHRARVIAHNHETSSQVTVIRDIIRQVENYQNRLNAQLKGIQISDLSDIKLEIVKKKIFTELTHDLEHQINSVNQEELQSDAFYERIQVFCNMVLKGKGGKISMDQVVESIDWHIKKNGIEEKSSQSTGTQGLLNATLMMLLLSDMMQDHVIVKIPIIFDEVGSLDGLNFSTLKVAAEERGFILLVANPEITGQIISELPCVNLGLWELEKIPSHLSKCIVVHNQAAERMTKQEVNQGLRLVVNEPTE